MNTLEAAKYLGIPAELLDRMRTRITSTLQSGPPYCKVIDKDGNTSYRYKKTELDKWKAKRNCLITAGEAAFILGISRQEVLSIHGIQKIQIGPFKGEVLLAPYRNMFMYIPKRRVA